MLQVKDNCNKHIATASHYPMQPAWQAQKKKIPWQSAAHLMQVWVDAACCELTQGASLEFCKLTGDLDRFFVKHEDRQ